MLPPPARATSETEDLVDRYVAYLRSDRGLAANSVLVYAPCARAFLAHRVATAGRLALDTLEAEASVPSWSIGSHIGHRSRPGS